MQALSVSRHRCKKSEFQLATLAPWIGFDVVLSAMQAWTLSSQLANAYQEQTLAVQQRGPSGYYISTRDGHGAANGGGVSHTATRMLTGLSSLNY